MKASKKLASSPEVKITEPTGIVPNQKGPEVKKPNHFLEEEDDVDFDLPLEDDLASLDEDLDLDEDDY